MSDSTTSLPVPDDVGVGDGVGLGEGVGLGDGVTVVGAGVPSSPPHAETAALARTIKETLANLRLANTNQLREMFRRASAIAII